MICIDDTQGFDGVRYYKDYIPTLRSQRSGLKVAYVDNNILPAALKYQRTEYAKKIRKDYEAGKIKERRCNMREYTLRTDGVCNTITTATKDNYIAIGCAMRGRYQNNGKTEQQIEVRDDELSNAITTVQKDSLIVENKSWLEKKYADFYEKHGYIPEYFVPYNGTEITDYALTLTANSNTSPTHSGTVLITEVDKERKS